MFRIAQKKKTELGEKKIEKQIWENSKIHRAGRGKYYQRRLRKNVLREAESNLLRLNKPLNWNLGD